MPSQNPSGQEHLQDIIRDRVEAASGGSAALPETVNIEWRGRPRSIPVISMLVDLLKYNPDTHRVRAQRSTDPIKEQDLVADPYGPSAQAYLHFLLMGDPADPNKPDPSFLALKEDLRAHGQTEPGIVSDAGVLINGNTRRAALKELGEKYMRVGVLPEDACADDLQSIELVLQLRKDHRRDYSFMNFLLALEERATSGDPAAKIQADFRIKPATYDRCRWILDFVKDAIRRSKVEDANHNAVSLRLIDFETHQGKLEELYRAYSNLKAKSPDLAEQLREQRLLAVVLKKSKTDLRLIEPDFAARYMKDATASIAPPSTAPVTIPGTSIKVPAASADVRALAALTDQALQAASTIAARAKCKPEAVAQAEKFLAKLDDSMSKALDLAGRQERLTKRRLGPAERLSDACDDLEQAAVAVAYARSTGSFDAGELDERLVQLKTALIRLADIVMRKDLDLFTAADSTAREAAALTDGESEGVEWLRTVRALDDLDG